MLYIGADHRGFALKEAIKAWILEEVNPVQDMGAFELDVGDDYPDFAVAVAQVVAKDPEGSKGLNRAGVSNSPHWV